MPHEWEVNAYYWKCGRCGLMIENDGSGAPDLQWKYLAYDPVSTKMRKKTCDEMAVELTHEE